MNNQFEIINEKFKLKLKQLLTKNDDHIDLVNNVWILNETLIPLTSFVASASASTTIYLEPENDWSIYSAKLSKKTNQRKSNSKLPTDNSIEPILNSSIEDSGHFSINIFDDNSQLKTTLPPIYNRNHIHTCLASNGSGHVYSQFLATIPKSFQNLNEQKQDDNRTSYINQLILDSNQWIPTEKGELTIEIFFKWLKKFVADEKNEKEEEEEEEKDKDKEEPFILILNFYLWYLINNASDEIKNELVDFCNKNNFYFLFFPIEKNKSDHLTEPFFAEFKDMWSEVSTLHFVELKTKNFI
jgi:hypothetical protein